MVNGKFQKVLTICFYFTDTLFLKYRTRRLRGCQRDSLQESKTASTKGLRLLFSVND